MKKVGIIGAGLSGLYAACYLSKSGYDVEVFEKNEHVGGRARIFEKDGFKFDMGPSWYWMPGLIDELFTELGEKREDYFFIERLNPSYKVFWKEELPTEVPADQSALQDLFDSFEQGGGKKLNDFLTSAQKKYDIAVPDFLEKPGLKVGELLNFKTLMQALKLDVLKSVDTDVSNRFKSEKARSILNFPVLFLGEMPTKIPSLYTLMNYADMALGTWYPHGGMAQLPLALYKIAQKNGAKFHFNTPITRFSCEKDKVTSLHSNDQVFKCDAVIGAADYNFIEQKLVPEKFRRYSTKYWENRRMAPSCLIFYLGIDKKIEGLKHHNLFFDESLEAHGNEIYDSPKWPEKPLFYVCAPSKTDKTVAPAGCENLFLLVPIAPDLEDTMEIRKNYFNLIIGRLEKQLDTSLKDHVKFYRDYCIKDFKADYNSFKGNAYGLANTLKQTANLKPKISSKLNNLFYCGQLTVPGPGVPPALVSGKIAAKLIKKEL